MGDTSKNRSKHQLPNKRAKKPCSEATRSFVKVLNSHKARWRTQLLFERTNEGDGEDQLNMVLQKRMTQLENDLENKSEENAKFEKKLGEIFMQHDDLKQYTRKFNFEIHGIPEKSDEEPEDIVLDFAKLMEIDLTYDDIDITHRLNKGRKSPRPIFNCSFQQLLQQRANVSSGLETSQEEWFKRFGSGPQKHLHQRKPNCL